MQSGNFLRNFFALDLPRSLLACLAQRERFKVTSHDTESSNNVTNLFGLFFKIQFIFARLFEHKDLVLGYH